MLVSDPEWDPKKKGWTLRKHMDEDYTFEASESLDTADSKYSGSDESEEDHPWFNFVNFEVKQQSAIQWSRDLPRAPPGYEWRNSSDARDFGTLRVEGRKLAPGQTPYHFRVDELSDTDDDLVLYVGQVICGDDARRKDRKWDIATDASRGAPSSSSGAAAKPKPAPKTPKGSVSEAAPKATVPKAPQATSGTQAKSRPHASGSSWI